MLGLALSLGAENSNWAGGLFQPSAAYTFAESNSRGAVVGGAGYSVVGSQDSIIVYFPVKITGNKLDLSCGFQGFVQKLVSGSTYSEVALGNNFMILCQTLVNEGNGQYAEVKYNGSRSCIINDNSDYTWCDPISPSAVGLSVFAPTDNLYWKYIIRLPLLGKYYSSAGRAASSFSSTVQMRVYNSAVTTITVPGGKTYPTDGAGLFTWTGTTPSSNFTAPTPITIGRDADAANLAVYVTGTSIDDGAWDGVVSVSRRASDYGAGQHNMACHDYNNAGLGQHWALYNHAQSSSTLSGIVGTSSTRWKKLLKHAGAGVYVSGGGCNDLQSAVRTVGQIQADKLAEWATVKAENPLIKIIATEFLPRTNVGNSAVLGGWNTTDCDTINAWLWAQKALGLIDEVVSYEVMRDPTNRNLWRTVSGVALSADGIHPTTIGHSIMAAQVRIAIMNVIGKIIALYDPMDIYNITPNVPATSTQISAMKNKALAGSAYDMAQATSGKQPIFNKASIGDSRGALDCLSTDKEMLCGTAIPYTEIDAIFVFNPTGAGTSRQIATGSLVAGSPNVQLNSGNLMAVGKQGGSTSFGSAVFADDTNYIVDWKAGASGLKTRVNNVLDINSATNPSYTAGINMLMGRGGTNGFRGKYGMSVFMQNVNDSDRDSIRASMKLLSGF